MTKQTFPCVCTWDQDLMYSMSSISGLKASFTVTEPSRVRVWGHLDSKRRTINAIDPSDAVMVALEVRCNGSRILGSVTGENILTQTHHYSALPVCGYVEVGAGSHTIQLYARAASTAATPPNANGLVEVKGGYNLMVVEVESI